MVTAIRGAILSACMAGALALIAPAFGQEPPPVPFCTSTAAGKCKPDGTTITVGAGGAISAASQTTSPGGSNGQIQYNNAGAFGGRAPSGTGTTVVTSTGAQTNGRCVEIDATGNHIAAAGACVSASGISELTGPVTAGPGSGAQASTITPTGVGAGSYGCATVTVNVAGQVTAASANSPCGGVSTFGYLAPALTAVPTSANTGLNTWVNQASASVADRITGNTITGLGTGGLSLRMRCKAVPLSPPYTVKALVTYQGPFANFYGYGIGFYDGTNKNQVVEVVASGSELFAVANNNTPTSFNANVVTVTRPGTMSTPVWLYMTNDGTNVKYGAGFDGVAENALVLASTALIGSFLGAANYTNVCSFLNTQAQSGSASANMTLMSFDVVTGAAF